MRQQFGGACASAECFPPCWPAILVLQVAATPGFERWQLFLVEWGYNTVDERHRASSSDRIRVIGLSQFDELMRGSV